MLCSAIRFVSFVSSLSLWRRLRSATVLRTGFPPQGTVVRSDRVFLGGEMSHQQRILEYLRKHPEQNNTVRLLASELNLTRSQVGGRLMQLEYMKLVSRSTKIIKDAYGTERKTHVYNSCNISQYLSSCSKIKRSRNSSN